MLSLQRVGACLVLSTLVALACAPSDAIRPARSTPTGLPLAFEFEAPDGQQLSSAETRGRVTVLLLIATFDMASQLSSRQANELLHTFTPRINVGAVIMEPAQYGQLKQTYQETLELDYPVVMADHATLNGRGPFGEVPHIPTLVVLDRAGRESARLLGPVSMEAIEDAIRAAHSR